VGEGKLEGYNTNDPHSVFAPASIWISFVVAASTCATDCCPEDWCSDGTCPDCAQTVRSDGFCCASSIGSCTSCEVCLPDAPKCCGNCCGGIPLEFIDPSIQAPSAVAMELLSQLKNAARVILRIVVRNVVPAASSVAMVTVSRKMIAVRLVELGAARVINSVAPERMDGSTAKTKVFAVTQTNALEEEIAATSSDNKCCSRTVGRDYCTAKENCCQVDACEAGGDCCNEGTECSVGLETNGAEVRKCLPPDDFCWTCEGIVCIDSSIYCACCSPSEVTFTNYGYPYCPSSTPCPSN